MNPANLSDQTKQPVAGPQNPPLIAPAKPIHNVTSSSSFQKEIETPQVVQIEAPVEVSHEVEIPEEVEKAGVTVLHGKIELPPDMKKLGVRPVGPSVPITQTTVIPQVPLPISDDQVLSGVNADITDAFKWLAFWCIRQLKKAHLTLKVIHGKIVRVKV